jgi:hypothetical protein
MRSGLVGGSISQIHSNGGGLTGFTLPVADSWQRLRVLWELFVDIAPFCSTEMVVQHCSPPHQPHQHHKPHQSRQTQQHQA